MRRFILAILCCLLLVTTVSAADTVEDLQSNTLVAANGSCDVTLTLQIFVDSVPSQLTLPLPTAAHDITVNGNAARASYVGTLRQVDLTGAVTAPGTHTLVIHYALPDAVREENGQLVLTLELLSGFSLPVERLRFTVTLPGKPEKKAG